ncbi:MAG: DMT family transporter [Pseudolabrys sp.]|nr:DMT family transporter [Pseudolabrys sp.]
MIDARLERRQRLTGIALICATVVFFAGLDTTAKYLNHSMSTVQVVWARYTGGFLLALVLSNPISRPALMRTSRPWLQIGRSLLLLGSTAFNFLALRWLQLDQTTAIMFSTPFLVAVLSGPLLGEWVGWRRWAAIIVGFAGVLLVTRPGFGGIHSAAALSALSVVCYGFYMIATRILARTDSNETTLFYSNLVGAVLMSALVPFFWSTPRDPRVIALMVLSGALGSIGHYLLIIAHRLAPPAVLAPFLYTQLVWAIAFSFLVFGELPNSWTLSGMAVVVASGLYLLHRDGRVGRQTVSGSLVE